MGEYMYNIYIYHIIYIYIRVFLLDVGFSAFHWFDGLASNMDNWTGSPRRPLPRLQLELVEAAFHLLWHGKNKWKEGIEGIEGIKVLEEKNVEAAFNSEHFLLWRQLLKVLNEELQEFVPNLFQDFWLCLVVHGLENTAQSPVPPFSTGLKTQSIGRGKFTGHSP